MERENCKCNYKYSNKYCISAERRMFGLVASTCRSPEMVFMYSYVQLPSLQYAILIRIFVIIFTFINFLLLIRTLRIL